ncbi:MAG: agmatine deiminase family protein [Verrucomicrobium sp.]|nr:agmatine deiminase family protein [Verrucomicrobium sp.]
MSLPAASGYRMPAEWAPHAATWLSWPRPEGISFPGGETDADAIWGRLASLLAQEEAVHINVFSPVHRQAVEAALRQWAPAPRHPVILHQFPAYEPWCRDHGPIFIQNAAGTAVVDWDYNAWGGKYPPYDFDDAVPRHVADYLDMPLFSPGLVMEGGSLDVDGEGTLLTTESCLLNPNRNPGKSREEIEAALRGYLGVEKILWLGDGILGDDTDGHVDDLTRFVSPGVVVTVVERDPADENYKPLLENRRRLETMTDARGRSLRVIDLPMPAPLVQDGQRLPASYANFYIANNQVLVPVFGDPQDDVACSILAPLFPGRRIVPFAARELIWGLGALHCITQQQPLFWKSV